MCIFKDPETSKRKLPPLLDYTHLVPPQPKTRATTDDSCSCHICSVARMKIEYSAYVNLHSNPMGAPSINPKSPPAKALTVCTRCFTEIGRGKPHPCVKTKKSDNLAHIVKNISGRSRAKVTSSTLKTVAADQGVSTRGGIVELQTGSKPLPVQIGTPKIKPKMAKFSHENLKKLQTANNLSDQTLL